MTLDPKSVGLGVVLALVASAILGGDPLYMKGYGLEVQLNGVRQEQIGTQIQAEARIAYAEASNTP